MSNTLALPRFRTQWGENGVSVGQVFTEPSQTVPDQSLTIPQIIARFTRSGMVPASIKMADQGGNFAADPDSDPLDDWNDLQSAAAAAKAAQEKQAPPQDPATDPASASAGA